MSQIKAGDTVHVHYEGRFENGEVFDSSSDRGPMVFDAGGDNLIPGFSNAVIGMAVGEKKTVTLPPEQAYGPRDPEQVQTVERAAIPEDAQVGDQLQAEAGDQTFNVMVTAIEGETVTLDANHFMAGKTLVFDIEVLAIGETS